MENELKYNQIDSTSKTVVLILRIKDFLLMFRVAHWVKNLFLFLPIFFAGEFFTSDRFCHVVIGFFAFSFVSSSVYMLNDIRDINQDVLHPVKRNRAIPSGRISIPIAILCMTCSLVVGLGLAILSGFEFILLIGVYFVLNLFYSLGLKHISILDILIISAGFVLRLLSGGVLARVEVSHWLVIMVFLLSLFLALGKRKDDLIVGETHGSVARKSMYGYNAEFLNIGLAVTSTALILAYLMYTLSPEVIGRLHTHRLYFTTIFVGAGLMRYLQLTYVEDYARSPVRVLFQDRFIQICLILWILSFYIFIYTKDLNFLTI